MNDKVTSWVRTVVPTLWSALIAWAVLQGLPASFGDLLGGLVEPVVVPAVLAAVYAAIRKVEPHLPDWLTVLLLGSAKPPTYGG